MTKMEVVSMMLMALLVCVHADKLNVQNEMIPLDAKLQDLLNVNRLNFHFERETEPSAEISADFYLAAETIAQYVEETRKVIINGSKDGPVIDPLYIPHIGPIEVSVPAVRVSADLYRVNVEGLKWFVMNDISFNAIRLALDLDFTIPRLTITGDYDGEARLALLIRHTAGGEFRIFVNRVEVAVNMRLGTRLIGGHLFLRELDINLDIHDTNVFFEGLIGNGWVNGVFNSIVQSISQESIQAELDNINEAINEALFDIIDDFLRSFTLDDILNPSLL